MTQYRCEYCDNILASEAGLRFHQRTAKYCLKKRGAVVSSAFVCNYCNRKFAQKIHLKTHLKICLEYNISLEKEKYEPELENAAKKITALQAEISKLKTQNKNLLAREKIKDKLLREKDKEIARLTAEKNSVIAHKDGQIEVYEKVSNRPTSVNTGGINTYIHPKLINIPIANIRPLTIETVREDMHKYTYAEFLRGLSGLKEFIQDIIVVEMEDADCEAAERNYVCTDTSRNKFHRLIESKEWKTDGGARFINNILDELRDVATEHFKTLVAEESASVKDEFKREQINATKAVVQPVFFGITESGERRKRLFEALRKEIRDIASI